MWSPLVDGDPAPRHRLSGLGRLVYLLVAMLPMALVGAYLNRRATLVYPAYGPPAHALGISAVDDQGQAGAIMWVAGDVIMVAVGLWAALAAMLAEERRLVAREARSAPLARGDGRTAG
jgi:cytochrome c oxidase assembly factor CtaG